MSKVNFNIQYEINPDKREEYFSIIREIKNLLKFEGLESYKVFEIKGKPNNFQEVYTFVSQEAFENFDDDQNERLNILINKLNDITMGNSTKYTTLFELEEV
jgi:quinol monooxygenase YgiN